VQARLERFAEPAVLLLLREDSAHGSDLLQRLPEIAGDHRIEMGNLYRLLRTLEEEGLVESEWADGKRTYSITDEGLQLLDDWVDALLRVRDLIEAFIRRYAGRR
jgi:DNA-binding PadR family transcriptional regulator